MLGEPWFLSRRNPRFQPGLPGAIWRQRVRVIMSNRLRLISGVALLISSFLLDWFSVDLPVDNRTKTCPRRCPLWRRLATKNDEFIKSRRGRSLASLIGKGRYQVIGTGGLSYCIVIDTSTGQCWALYPTVSEPKAATCNQSASAKPQPQSEQGEDVSASDRRKGGFPWACRPRRTASDNCRADRAEARGRSKAA